MRERHIGQPILWRPSTEQEHQLRQDWEELMDYIVLGSWIRLRHVLVKSCSCVQKAQTVKPLQKALVKWGSNRYFAAGILFTERVYSRHFKRFS